MYNADYTRKEAAIIRAAWDNLWYLFDGDYTRQRKLSAALAYERKDRSSLLVAKAILVECAFCLQYGGADWEKPYGVGDLGGISDGCAQAIIVGEMLRGRAKSDSKLAADYAKALETARAACVANRESTKRRIDAIR
jgi:hypothetical protein